MRAVRIDEPGGPEVLRVGSARRPEPGPEEILVRVRAAAVNRADVFQREGHYPPPEGGSEILGLDVAGVVEEVGGDDHWLEPGDRVFGLVPGGGYAEYAVIHREMAMRIPETLSFPEAAAVPEVFLTAYQALFWLGRLEAGDRVLIHAGASGVGTAAIQLARAWGTGMIFTTSSGGKTDLCRRLGADRAIDYETESFGDIVSQESGGGVEVVVDVVGAPYFQQNVDALATDGRIVVLAFLGGSVVEELDLRDLFRKRGHLVTSTLRSRSRTYQIALTREWTSFALPLLEEGRIAPVIDRTYPWHQVAEAHRYVEADRTRGKVVLEID